MNAAASKHPPREFLQAFGLGKLDDVAATKVSLHLETCADCKQQVAELSCDSLLGKLQSAHQAAATPAPSETMSPRAPAPLPEPASERPAGVPPELLDNSQYDILRELGAGGMGVVYLAKNKLMDRLEVLKVINTAMMRKAGALDRFLREIRAAAALSHDNVVKAHSALQFGELLVFAMEYVEGDDLAKVVKSQGALPIANACHYVRQVALGLQHAHDKKMVHRDIKPHNLILAREGKKHVVKILDFGLAKATSEKKVDGGLTGEGKMLGTPDYMAPEQIQDAATADIRADIYSLGCTLYYLLAGSTPFSSNSLYGLLHAQQTQQAPMVNMTRPEVPVELAAVVAKMMAKDPAKRYQKPLEVAQALLPFVKPGAKGAAPPVQVAPPRVELAPQRAETMMPAPALAMPIAPPKPANAFAFEPAPAAPAPAPKKAKAPAPRRFKPALFAGVAVAGLMLLGLLALLGGILRVQTKDGTIVLENLPPDVEVTVDGNVVKVKSVDGKTFEIRIIADKKKHRLEVKRNGIRVFGQEVEVDAGGRKPIAVRWEPAGIAKGPAARPDAKPAAKAIEVETPLAPGARKAIVKNGTWRVEGNELVQAAPDVGELVFGDPTWTDYTFEYEAKWIEGWPHHGMTVRSRPNVREVFFLGGWGNTESCSSTLRNEKITKQRRIRDRPVVKDTWNHLKVLVRGRHCECYRDGVLLLNFDDIDPGDLWGQVGLYSSGVFRFRNIRVTDPNGKVLFDGMPEAAAITKVAAAADGFVPRYKNQLGMAFALVPKGKSWLGGGGKAGSKEVVISNDFYLGVYEVTQDEWVRLMEYNPSFFSRQGRAREEVKAFSDDELKRFPVEVISWKETQIFLARLNEMDKKPGWIYRLPTELEWEYACRGGPSDDRSASAFDFYFARPTNAMLQKDNNFGGILGVGLRRTSKVGSYLPNKLGLHDMHGNVVEWCADEIPGDPRDPNSPPKRVIRGGHFWGDHDSCRAAYRFVHDPSFRTPSMGLRVARVPVGNVTTTAAPSAAPDRKATPPTADGFVPLFNGKDLDGWKAPAGGDKSIWRTEAGVLVGSGGRGYLYSERADYSDFELRAEAMIGPGENSGIFVRSPSPGSKQGYEVDINDSARGDGKSQTGSILIYPLNGKSFAGTPVDTVSHRVNEWLAMTIRMTGNQISVKVNDKLVASYTDTNNHFSKGHIALQHYVPGQEIRFRRIEIKELPPAKAEVAPAKAAPPDTDGFRLAHANRSGVWKIHGEELAQESIQIRDGLLMFGSSAWTDYNFTFEAKKVFGRGEIGIVYRTIGAQMGQFTIGKYDGTWISATSLQNGRVVRMRERKTVALQQNQWYKMAVHVRGSQFKCFLDDQLALEFEDKTNPQGAVGFWTWNTIARFRNVQVTDPDGKILCSGLPMLERPPE